MGDFCYAYMPIAAMYFSPLALLERNVGLMFRYGLAVGCLVATVCLFHRMVALPGAQSQKDLYLLGGGAILLVFQFVLQDLDDGGPHLILLGILSSAIYSVWRKRECLGSVLFGLSIALKSTPAIFLLLFLETAVEVTCLHDPCHRVLDHDAHAMDGTNELVDASGRVDA